MSGTSHADCAAPRQCFASESSCSRRAPRSRRPRAARPTSTRRGSRRATRLRCGRGADRRPPLDHVQRADGAALDRRGGGDRPRSSDQAAAVERTHADAGSGASRSTRRRPTRCSFGAPARDRHGNPIRRAAPRSCSAPRDLPARLDRGRARRARVSTSEGCYLWCYDGRAHAPDSTARDFDALGIVDEDESLPRSSASRCPGRYRLWAFADLNGNRSFEPNADVLPRSTPRSR